MRHFWGTMKYWLLSFLFVYGALLAVFVYSFGLCDIQPYAFAAFFTGILLLPFFVVLLTRLPKLRPFTVIPSVVYLIGVLCIIARPTFWMPTLHQIRDALVVPEDAISIQMTLLETAPVQAASISTSVGNRFIDAAWRKEDGSFLLSFRDSSSKRFLRLVPFYKNRKNEVSSLDRCHISDPAFRFIGSANGVSVVRMSVDDRSRSLDCPIYIWIDLIFTDDILMPKIEPVRNTIPLCD